MKAIYVTLVLYNNEVQDIKSFITLEKAEVQAIALANKWYKVDGISSMEEMQNYYGSEAYFNSGDDAHICIEEIYSITQTQQLLRKEWLMSSMVFLAYVYQRD